MNESTVFESVLSWLKSLHDPATFNLWLSQGGVILASLIVFAETGLLLGFFLPGDSLLITAGVLAQPDNPNGIPGLSIIKLQMALTFAAIIGNSLGYFLGRKTGDLIRSKPDSRFFKRKHLEQAHAFYEKRGPFAIIAARFVPILRTFVPFVAGASRMRYRTFLTWDLFGGTFWIGSLLWIGYFLGQTQIANRLDKLIVLVIFVSLLPMIIGVIRARFVQTSAKSSQ